MTLQVVAPPMIVILATLEVSFMLLENIRNTGITHVDHIYDTGLRCHCYNKRFLLTGQEPARLK